MRYTPRSEHLMPSHGPDPLLSTPEEGARRRGCYVVEDDSRAHWKRFLFD